MRTSVIFNLFKRFFSPSSCRYTFINSYIHTNVRVHHLRRVIFYRGRLVNYTRTTWCINFNQLFTLGKKNIHIYKHVILINYTLLSLLECIQYRFENIMINYLIPIIPILYTRNVAAVAVHKLYASECVT